MYILLHVYAKPVIKHQSSNRMLPQRLARYAECDPCQPNTMNPINAPETAS
jgi:hypothetical protein